MSHPVSKVASTDFYRDVVDGLTNDQKSIPSKYFYDERGSELFEEICKLDEYYLTRAELELMKTHIREICSTIGRNALLVELGSGSSLKTRLLLHNLEEPAAYVPVDISSDFLEKTAENLRSEFDGLSVFPVSADYTRAFQLPERDKAEKTVLYYPGSTIGNFTRKQAVRFLKRMADILNNDDGFLIGVDLVKDVAILEAAYNDSRGVTARFNLNLLRRINIELNGDFDLKSFRHSAIFNREESRIEMHLVSKKAQKVTIGEHTFSFDVDESIHTENSYKYSYEMFSELVSETFNIIDSWRDAKGQFLLCYLESI